MLRTCVHFRVLHTHETHYERRKGSAALSVGHVSWTCVCAQQDIVRIEARPHHLPSADRAQHPPTARPFSSPSILLVTGN